MSKAASRAIRVPARVSAQELADAMGRDVTEVQAVLTAREEPDAPEDILSSSLARAVARTLGFDVAVEARDLALEHLYTYESIGDVQDDPGGRAGRIVAGVVADLDGLDAEIESASEHWSVARMPVIDRNVLRIGLYELQNHPETPTGVIVAEAVRMARTYSTEKSGSFVNGVLATLARIVRET